jgi:hypothetical protein
MEVVMETEIVFGLQQIDEYWYATIDGTPVGPGAKHKEVANVFYRWLKDGACRDLWDIKESVLDAEFKKRNVGR